LRYAWKANTPPLSYEQQGELIQAGKMKREEGWFQLKDVVTGAPVRPHASSISWNDYRKRWVMIVEQAGGSSSTIGEIWFAEADTPTGPWVYAQKVVTHDRQSLYNPNHLSFFDQDGGRLIYFDGTYSADFSGNPEKTPRYEYNLMIYRLALDDPRLALPAAVYRVRGAGEPLGLAMRDAIETKKAWDRIEEVAFYAVPGKLRPDGLVPVFAARDGQGWRLQPGSPRPQGEQPLFYALPAASEPAGGPIAGSWDCTVLGMGQTLNLNLTLMQEGRRITGDLAGSPIRQATFDSGKLEFRMAGDGKDYSFTGEVRADRLEGEWREIDGGKSGKWFAVR
ncbi:MAG: hypothetical protein ACREIB_14325, partial [Pseudomonadota bacterium]